MNEFAKMIYKNWTDNDEYMERSLYFKKGLELVNRLEAILSFDLNNELYELFTGGCFEIEESAFIAGFEYACKCLSDGKIEFAKIMNSNEE